MLLPGPEAQQLATYIGWLLHGTLGGVVAGALLVLPSMVILWMLSYVYAAHGEVAAVAAVFYGLKPVERFAWLTPPQMLAGLALAESTPGPLIMVLQFVGFVAAWQNPGPLHPLGAATLGALMTTWVTFLPCFLWILLGAPYIERLRGQRALTAALSTITAAVVGVVLNLALWFAQHVLFPTVSGDVLIPGFRGLDGFALTLALTAGIAMGRFKVGVIPVILAGALAGSAWRFLCAWA